jgi:hypothetical protein
MWKRTIWSLIAASVCVVGAILVLQGSRAPESVESFEPPARSDREVDLADVPAPVRETILREAGVHKVSEVEEVTTEGSVHYEADWMEDGQEIEIRVDPSGNLLDRGVGSDDENEPDEGSEDDSEEGGTDR